MLSRAMVSMLDILPTAVAAGRKAGNGATFCSTSTRAERTVQRADAM
jgi:hypothetical protein